MDVQNYMGSIALFPYGWAPEGWALCDGAHILVDTNPALFALLGNRFGGDGQMIFALPNLPPVKTTTGTEVAYYICVQGNFPSRAW